MAGKNYIDPLLSTDSLGYKPYGMINETVLPSRTVKKDTGKLATYDADNIRLVTSMKGAESGTPVVQMKIAMQSAWSIDEYALKAFVSDKEVENEDQPFNARRDRSRFCMNLLSIQREIGLKEFMQDDGNFTNSLTLSGVNQWDAASPDVVGDINTAVQTVADAIGVPDTSLSVLVSRGLQRQLVKLSAITDIVTGVNGLRNMASVSMIKPNELASAFEVKEWLVGDGHYNTAKYGQTAALAPIWGNGFWVFNRQTGAEMLSQPFGFTMRKKGGPVVDRWRDIDRKGEWVRATDEWDQYIVNEKAAYFIKNPLAGLGQIA
jgi:hypothetical protein